jgi:hypothetical protein
MNRRLGIGLWWRSPMTTSWPARHRRVDDAKVALGERGPVWWTEGEPDLNRHLVKNTPYAAWFAKLQNE